MAGVDHASGDGDIADLRRRVYGPNATDEDRVRYAAAMEDGDDPSGDPDPAPPGPVTAPAAAVRRRRRWPLVAVVGAVAVAALVVAVLLRPTPPVGSPPDVLPLTADERATLVNALVIGTDAGIAAYLVTHSQPATIHDATVVDSVERRGIGTSDVSVLQDGSVSSGYVVDGRTGETEVPTAGRFTVLLVVAQSADVGWEAESGTGDHPKVVARRAGFQREGALTSATIAYAEGARPDRLRIEVPAGVPWGAAIVYTN